jgi:hypothetical protein
MAITRRGFLSLCLSLPIIAKVPVEAEPIVKRASEGEILKLVHNSLYGKLGRDVRVERYSFTMGSDMVEPGRIALLRGIPSTDFLIERLIMNHGGFGILHMKAGTEIPLGVGDENGEVASDHFGVAAHRPALEYATVGPDTEIILAAVNRNPYPVKLFASLMGAARVEG